MVAKSEFITFKKNPVTITSQELQQNFELQQRCPNCGSTRTSLVKMPEGAAHYAVRRCRQCDRFLAWQAKPENQERRRRQQAQITTLLESSQLNQWEREFLTGLQGKRLLSPKQQKVLAQIDTKLGGQS